MWSFSYRRLISALSKSYRCISIDLAGMGMSGKPHVLGHHGFDYSYLEQSQIVESVITRLNLQNITFLSFDHGGPIGFGVMTRSPDRFSRIIITNSWAWSCHTYRATKFWSSLAPLSKRGLKWIMLNKKRWMFEDKKDLENPDIWYACTAPYQTSDDFAPMTKMAQQLTRAQSYFDDINRNFYRLADKDIDIVWTTKGGGLFPEFVSEDMFLRRWRDHFPQASLRIVEDAAYYSLVTRPSKILVDTILSN